MGWVADVFEQDDGWNLLQGPPGWSICLTQSLSLSFPGVRDFLLDSYNHIATLQGGVPTTLPLLQCPKQQYHCTMRCFPRVLHPRPVPERSRHAMHMHPTQRGVCRIVRACNYVMQHRLLVASHHLYLHSTLFRVAETWQIKKDGRVLQDSRICLMMQITHSSSGKSLNFRLLVYMHGVREHQYACAFDANYCLA